jgi:hypothetical protein
VFRQILIKSQNTEFNENPMGNSVLISCAQTDKREDEAILIGALQEGEFA